jgi:hypothetical protein
VENDETRTNFLIPRFFESPAFYRVGSDLVLLVTEVERVLINTTTCWGIDAAHREPSGEPWFVVEGTAVVCKGRGAGWFGLRRFVPFRKEGGITVLREDFDLDELSRHILLRACDLNDYDPWDRQRGHSAFMGEGLEEAAFALRRCLNEGGATARRYAAHALFELFRHRHHGCFEENGYAFLRSAPGILKSVLEREEDAEVKQAILEALDESWGVQWERA